MIKPLEIKDKESVIELLQQSKEEIGSNARTPNIPIHRNLQLYSPRVLHKKPL